MARVDREAIKNGFFQKMAEEAEQLGLITLTTAEEREISWRSILQSNPNPCGSIWVFAYGSLLWNPAFRLVDTIEAHLDGYHRDFNLRTYIGRGNQDQPGLVLGLEEGGACQGQVLKVDPQHLEEELSVLWSREMLASAYKPTWVEIQTPNEVKVYAVAFIIDCNYRHYAGNLSFEEKCFDLAHGTGALGCASEYLFETVEALTKMGISDPWLNRCAVHVKKIHDGKEEL